VKLAPGEMLIASSSVAMLAAGAASKAVHQSLPLSE
jgi:hypothetical protein